MCPIGDVIQACFVTKMLYKIKNPSIFYTIDLPLTTITAQKMKFSIKDFFSKCDQIRSFLPIRSHLLKKSLMKNFIFCAVDSIS